MFDRLFLEAPERSKENGLSLEQLGSGLDLIDVIFLCKSGQRFKADKKGLTYLNMFLLKIMRGEACKCCGTLELTSNDSAKDNLDVFNIDEIKQIKKISEEQSLEIKMEGILDLDDILHPLAEKPNSGHTESRYNEESTSNVGSFPRNAYCETIYINNFGHPVQTKVDLSCNFDHPDNEMSEVQSFDGPNLEPNASSSENLYHGIGPTGSDDTAEKSLSLRTRTFTCKVCRRQFSEMSMLSSHWYIDHPDILSTTMDVYNKDLVNQFGKNSESDEIHQNTEIIQVGDDHDTEDEVQLETKSRREEEEDSSETNPEESIEMHELEDRIHQDLSPTRTDVEILQSQSTDNIKCRSFDILISDCVKDGTFEKRVKKQLICASSAKQGAKFEKTKIVKKNRKFESQSLIQNYFRCYDVECCRNIKGFPSYSLLARHLGISEKHFKNQIEEKYEVFWKGQAPGNHFGMTALKAKMKCRICGRLVRGRPTFHAHITTAHEEVLRDLVPAKQLEQMKNRTLPLPVLNSQRKKDYAERFNIFQQRTSVDGGPSTEAEEKSGKRSLFKKKQNGEKVKDDSAPIEEQICEGAHPCPVSGCKIIRSKGPSTLKAQMILWHLKDHYEEELKDKNDLDDNSKDCPHCGKFMYSMHCLLIHMVDCHDQLRGIVDDQILDDLNREKKAKAKPTGKSKRKISEDYLS